MTAAENRKRAPVCAAFIDAMRAEFGDVRVTYIREGDFEVGKRDESVGVMPCLAPVEKKGRK